MPARKKNTASAASRPTDEIPLPPGVKGPAQHEDADWQPEPCELLTGAWWAGDFVKRMQGKYGPCGILARARWGVDGTEQGRDGCFWLSTWASLRDFLENAPIGAKLTLQYLGEKELESGNTFHQFRWWAEVNGRPWGEGMGQTPETSDLPF